MRCFGSNLCGRSTLAANNSHTEQSLKLIQALRMATLTASDARSAGIKLRVNDYSLVKMIIAFSSFFRFARMCT